jgi:predicted RNase H-like nuclease (RuvC/YqgF family)
MKNFSKHYQKRIAELKAENARLKADFSQMTAWGRGLESDLSRARVELMLVKAEVERLKMSAYNRLSMRIEIDKLNARIERLIKAGDLMADGINGDYNYSLPCIEKWEAAKKGGQP